MLNIYLGDMENAIYHPPVFFDNRIIAQNAEIVLKESLFEL